MYQSHIPPVEVNATRVSVSIVPGPDRELNGSLAPPPKNFRALARLFQRVYLRTRAATRHNSS